MGARALSVTLSDADAKRAALWVRIGLGNYQSAGDDFASEADKLRDLAERLEGKRA